MKFHTKDLLTPTALDIIKAARQEVFGGPVKFTPAVPGPGVLGFGVDSGVRTLSVAQIVTGANAFSTLVEALMLYRDGCTLPEPRIIDVTDAEPYLAEMRTKFDQPVVFDIEYDPHRVVLSIAVTYGGNQIVFTDHFREVTEILATHYYVCAHGGKADQGTLRDAYGIKVPIWFDTMTARHALHPASQGHLTLKELAQRILGIPDWESDIKQFTGSGENADYSKIPHDNLVQYNGMDVYATWHLMARLLPLVQDERVFWYEMTANYDMLSDVEYNRVRIDVPYTQALSQTFTDESVEVLATLREVTGNEKFNPNSPKQVGEALAAMGVATPDTKASTLTMLMEHDQGVEFIKPLLQYRSLTKLNSTYCISLLHKQTDGFVRAEFNTEGTSSGRLSGRKPNLQNIPRDKRLRGMFIAHSPEDVLIEVDYMQAELRAQAILSGDPYMIAAFQPDSPDFFDGLIPHAFPERFPDLDTYLSYEEQKCGGDEKDYRAKLKGCVPLTTKILTQRGWLNHNEVRIGDMTPGLVSNGVTAWTRINAIHHWDSKPVYRMGHARWSVEVTDNHRWAVANTDTMYKHNDYSFTMQETKDIKLKSSSLLVAGRVNQPDREDLTVAEVRILAWIASDGYLKISELTGITSQAGGRRQAFNGSICQAKTPYVKEIRDLLESNGLDFREDTKPGVNYDTHHTFYLRSPYLRELYRRAGLDDENYEKFVLSLGTAQREAFLEVFCHAEGHVDATGTWLITQNVGSKHDSVVLCATLLGYRVTSVVHTKGTRCRRIRLNKVSHVGMTNGNLEYLRDAPVWCVTTDLGTWTAHDGDKAFVTGNCVYGLNFGRGAAAIGLSLKLPIDIAQDIIDAFMQAYPVWACWREDVMDAAVNSEARDMLTAFTGHHFEAEVITGRNKSAVQRSALSYLPQSTVGGLCTTAAINVNRRLKAEYPSAKMVMLIHDAIYVNCKRELAEDIGAMVSYEMEKVGRDVFGDTVLFTAEPGYSYRWGEHE